MRTDCIYEHPLCLGSVLCTGTTAVNKIDKVPALLELVLW